MVDEDESATTDDEFASGFTPDTDEMLVMSEEHCAAHHQDEEVPEEVPSDSDQ